MESIKEMIRVLQPSQFEDLRRWVNVDETQRRRALAAEAEVIADLRNRGVIEDTAPPPSDPTDAEAYPEWSNPGTAHERMYVRGDHVRHRGRVWESVTDNLNSWEPGGEGVYSFIWRDVTDTLTPPEPPEPPLEPDQPDEQPAPAWQAGVEYSIGDQVQYNSVTYTVLQAHTSQDYWPPDQSPSLYQPAPA